MAGAHQPKGKTGSLLSQMPPGQQKLLAGACETLEKLARELTKGCPGRLAL
jgi:hypothetical protein